MKENIDKLEESLNEGLGKANNSFSISDGYFEKLPESIMNIINSLPDFEKSAVNNPFIVPENYFEKLPLEISGKISEKNSEKLPLFSFMSRPRFVIPAAFATIIFLAGLFLIKQNKTSNYDNQEISFDELKN